VEILTRNILSPSFLVVCFGGVRISLNEALKEKKKPFCT
jgi:hypothetical protein